MPLPGRPQTFALETCRDMLEKLDREASRFEAADNQSDRADHAFNAAVTAWQVCDWVFRDLTQHQRAHLKLKTLTQLQARSRVDCRELHLCRIIATASKHWEVDKFPDATIGAMVTATPHPVADTTPQSRTN